MYPIFKRLFDLILSLVLIIIFLPVFICIILFQIAFNKADVFYLQRRIGYRNVAFGIIKFSTMLKDSEQLPGGLITVRNDPRVTKIGKYLRISKLNELPQLFNVLIGQMSFVGPRPLTQKGVELYSGSVKSFIYKSKPGITGISSVLFRDEEKLVSTSILPPETFYKQYIFPFKGELEQWYFINKSMSIDFLILFLTGLKIIAPKSGLEYKIFPTLPKNDLFN